MRLVSLALPGFKNLRDFSLGFSDSSTTVVLGRNGSGKSNLLEALIMIFRDLDLGGPPEFPFELTYTCKGHTVDVSADPARKTRRTIFRVDGAPLAAKAFRERRDELLPSNLFAYYSGPSRRLGQWFALHQRQFYDALLEGEDVPLRRLFYARPIHSQFVLLAFFSSHDPQIDAFLAEHFEIVGLESVLFVLHEPDWAKGRSAYRGVDGDPRFWNAKGTVQHFLDRLYRLSLAPSRHAEPVDVSYDQPYKRTVSEDTLHLYLDSRDALRELAAGYDGEGAFFKALESTYISDLIREVRIRVWKKGLDVPLTFTELSEGEQQLLTVLGLLKFTSSSEALFLLDEPDTHLNPRWSYEYLHMLDQIIQRDESAHVVIATHDPVLIGGLTRDEVQVLETDRLTSTSRAARPREDPKGMGVAALLTSELFGMQSTLDRDTQQKLDRSQELVATEQLRSSAEEEELQRLNEELAKLGFSRTIRDPLYEKFMKAVGAMPEFKKPDVSVEDLRAQEETAISALRKILDSET